MLGETWAASPTRSLTRAGRGVYRRSDERSSQNSKRSTILPIPSRTTLERRVGIRVVHGGANEYAPRERRLGADPSRTTRTAVFPSSSAITPIRANTAEFLTAEIASPLGIATDYLNNNWGVVCEIHYRSSIGTTSELATRSSQIDIAPLGLRVRFFQSEDRILHRYLRVESIPVASSA